MPFFESIPNTRSITYRTDESLANKVLTTPEELQSLITQYRAMSPKDRETFKGALKQNDKSQREQLQLINCFEQLVKDVQRSFTLSFPDEPHDEITVLVGQPPVKTVLKLSDPAKHVIFLNPEEKARLQALEQRSNELDQKQAILTEAEQTELRQVTQERDDIAAIKIQRVEAALTYFLFQNGTVFASQLAKIGPTQGLLSGPLEYIMSDLTINGQRMMMLSTDYTVDLFLSKDESGKNDFQLHSMQVVFQLLGKDDQRCYYKDKKTGQVMSASLALSEAIDNAFKSKRNLSELTVKYCEDDGREVTLTLEPLLTIQQVVNTGVIDNKVFHFEARFNIHQPDIVMKKPLMRQVKGFIKDKFAKKAPGAPVVFSQATQLGGLTKEMSKENILMSSAFQSIQNYKAYFCDQRKDDRKIEMVGNQLQVKIVSEIPFENKKQKYYIESNQDIHAPGVLFKAQMDEGGKIDRALIQIICEDAADVAIAAYQKSGEVATFDLSHAPDEDVRQYMAEVFQGKLKAAIASMSDRADVKVSSSAAVPFKIERGSKSGVRLNF